MRAAPYLFDLDLSAAPEEERRPEDRRTEAIRAEAQAAGYARGLQEGRAAAEAQAARRQAEAIERIAAGAEALLSRLDRDRARLERETVEVALAAARRLAPALVAREPVMEIAAFLLRCLPHLQEAPHVVVRLRAGEAAAAGPLLERLARDRGFPGRLVVLGDPDIPAGDCRIEWADGGFVRDRTAVEQRIEAAVGAYLAGRGAGDDA